MIDHYVLDADHKLRSAGLFEWAAFFEDAEARRVGADVVGDVRVSVRCHQSQAATARMSTGRMARVMRQSSPR